MKNARGFTLIELATVVTVISLIVGGIIIGQDMVRRSQLQSVIGDLQTYKRAVIQFQDKYLALPGDFSAATGVWGAESSCPSAYTATPHTTTCNGDGNGTIASGGSWLSSTDVPETFRAWQQLADAGMIEGQYTGVTGPNNAGEGIPGSNIPISRLSNGGYTLFFAGQGGTTEGNDWWTASFNHVIGFGAHGSCNWAYKPVLTPTEALQIDMKIDDGYPGSGIIMTTMNTTPTNGSCTLGAPPAGQGCHDTDTQATAVYNTAWNAPACTLLYITGF